jgi:hypothetical protein
MSDAPQGPDWWLASDRKWHPPTAQPGAALPPPPRQSIIIGREEPRVPLTKKVSTWVYGVLGALAGAWALLLASATASAATVVPMALMSASLLLCIWRRAIGLLGVGVLVTVLGVYLVYDALEVSGFYDRSRPGDAFVGLLILGVGGLALWRAWVNYSESGY